MPDKANSAGHDADDTLAGQTGVANHGGAADTCTTERLGVGHSTVARLLKREGMNHLSALAPARPESRYEHDAPVDLMRLNIKKLGRFERPGRSLHARANRQQRLLQV